MAIGGKKDKATQQVPLQDAQETEAGQAIARRRALDEIVPELMGGGSYYSRDELMAVTNFDEAVALAVRAHGPLVYADQELGDGFAVLTEEQKRLLVGVPLVLLEWAFRKGDFARPFVSIRLMARNPDGSTSKYVVNDGSAGIAEQLADYQIKTGRIGGMFVGKGLRASDYEVEVDGQTISATTFYLDTAKA